MVFLCLGNELGDTAAQEVCFCFSSQIGKGVVGGRLFLRGRGGKQGFGIGGEVLGAVRAVEAFWEDYQGGTGGGGFEDFGAGVGEVVGFVGAWRRWWLARNGRLWGREVRTCC